MQVSSETRRDWSSTLSRDSRPRNRVMAAKDSSGKNLVNLGQGDDFLGPETQFRPTLTTDYLTKLL